MTELLTVDKLDMHFPITGGVFRHRVGTVYAVNGVSFSLERGETLGIVGESGCGKTTLARTIARLYQPTAGSLRFEGQEISSLSGQELKALRREIQVIFQDPYASLNPRRSVVRCLEEPLLLHGIGDANERLAQVEAMILAVGLRREDLHKYPHEFSGGQRQRIGIARALMLRPRLVIADEPVSALDVSIQSQVLNLMADLQRQRGLSYIFISHDLTVVKYVSDRVVVMYLGHVVEIARSDEIYHDPQHPYTHALLTALPIPDPARRGRQVSLAGDIPSPSAPPPGCVFHTRCRHAEAICRREIPVLRSAESPTHSVACHIEDAVQREREFTPPPEQGAPS